MRRRTLLTSGAAAVAAGFAGCAARGSPPAPQIPQSLLDDGGWTKYDDTTEVVFEQSYLGTTVTAEAHTVQYEDAELRQSIREKTLGTIDTRLAVFSASRINVSPDLASLPMVGDQVVDQAETAARGQFVSVMESAGLTDVRQTGTGSLTVGTGQSARVTEYSAVYAFDGVEFPVTEGTTISLPAGELAVEGLLALWRKSGDVFVAGGAHPGENYADSVSESLTDAITVAVDIDLGLTPDAYRQELLELVKAVE